MVMTDGENGLVKNGSAGGGRGHGSSVSITGDAEGSVIVMCRHPLCASGLGSAPFCSRKNRSFVGTILI